MSGVMSRLTMLHISLIGAGVALVVALALYFVPGTVKSKKEDIEKVKAETVSLQDQGGTEEKVKGKNRQLADAKTRAAADLRDWNRDSAFYMPALNLSGELLSTYENTLIHMPSDWGRFLNRWYDQQRNQGVAREVGVNFPIPSFPADPNYIAKLTSITFPGDKPWPLVVNAKSFNMAMAHLKKFNGMRNHGMPVVNNVALAGQSPDLKMSYDLALYIIPSREPARADPFLGGAEGGEAASNTGYPGIPGAPPGSFGGPPPGGGRTGRRQATD